MAITLKALIESKYANDSLTEQYSDEDYITVIDKFTATNISGSTETLTIHLVPSGETEGNENIITYSRNIASGETYPLPEVVGHVLETGDSIYVVASTANTIVIRASGHIRS